MRFGAVGGLAEGAAREVASACEAKELNCCVSADHHCIGSTAAPPPLAAEEAGLGAAALPGVAEKACAH